MDSSSPQISDLHWGQVDENEPLAECGLSELRMKELRFCQRESLGPSVLVSYCTFRTFLYGLCLSVSSRRFCQSFEMLGPIVLLTSLLLRLRTIKTLFKSDIYPVLAAFSVID